MKHQQPKPPNIDSPMQWVDTVTATPAGFSSGRWFQMMWPWMFLALLAGTTFILLQLALFAIRRHIYNRNRNLKYPAKRRNLADDTPKRPKKNQRWMTKSRRTGSPNKIMRPLPSGFAETLCDRWDKIHDSPEEMLKLGEMLIELDDYVDNSFVYQGDRIVGRRPGMKGFLSEHCPHISYTTAMGYRTLALKAREAKSKGKLPQICQKCDTVHDFTEAFDTCLNVEHHPRDYQRRRKHRNLLGNSQSLIATLHEETRTTLEKLDIPQRRRFISVMQKLIRRLSVS